jgi:GAF domain-containing protein
MKNFEDISTNALKMLKDGMKHQMILNFMALETEKIIGKGSVVSILLLDKSGLLRNGASPQLPKDYLEAIDGIRPDPKVGTCAAAAATGKMVMTPDFRADHKWEELRHLPLSIGYSGAWSMPIITDDGKVLGTFGTYFKEIRYPSDEEINGVKILAQTASRVIVQLQ